MPSAYPALFGRADVYAFKLLRILALGVSYVNIVAEAVFGIIGRSLGRNGYGITAFYRVTVALDCGGGNNVYTALKPFGTGDDSV